MSHKRNRIVLVLFALTAAACSSSADVGDPVPTNLSGPAPLDVKSAYQPQVRADELSPAIANPWFPAPVGAEWHYEARTEDGLETIDLVVLEETRDVWGTVARVVRDTVFLDGEMTEDTWDWYGQDSSGNVWYLGEDTSEYEDGRLVCSCGAWEAGKDGAVPGVVMLGNPAVGDAYRQEYYAGEAEDFAEVLSTNETVTVAAGSFDDCLKTRDRSVLDPELDELKYYCPGVGNVLVEEGDVRVELVSYTGL